MGQTTKSAPTSAKSADEIKLRKIQIQRARVVVENLPGSPLVMSRFDEKAKQQMLEGQQGNKRRIREKRDPQAEFEAARYRLPDGSDGVPAVNFKNAIVTAAHKNIGIPKTEVRRAVFVHAQEGELVRLDTEVPLMREDVVRLRDGTAYLRFRPCYAEWRAELLVEYDTDLVGPETLFNLIERAGWGGGIGENRPEKSGGPWGRFRIARSEQL